MPDKKNPRRVTFSTTIPADLSDWLHFKKAQGWNISALLEQALRKIKQDEEKKV